MNINFGATCFTGSGGFDNPFSLISAHVSRPVSPLSIIPVVPGPSASAAVGKQLTQTYSAYTANASNTSSQSTLNAGTATMPAAFSFFSGAGASVDVSAPSSSSSSSLSSSSSTPAVSSCAFPHFPSHISSPMQLHPLTSLTNTIAVSPSSLSLPVSQTHTHLTSSSSSALTSNTHDASSLISPSKQPLVPFDDKYPLSVKKSPGVLSSGRPEESELLHPPDHPPSLSHTLTPSPPSMLPASTSSSNSGLALAFVHTPEAQGKGSGVVFVHTPRHSGALEISKGANSGTGLMEHALPPLPEYTQVFMTLPSAVGISIGCSHCSLIQSNGCVVSCRSMTLSIIYYR